MQSPSSSSPYVPGSSLDYSHHPSTSSMHPHQVFDHHHHLHYGLHHQIPPPPPPPPPPPSHHHSHHPGSHHHHQGNSHHPLQPPPPPPPSLGPSPLHHHHHHHSLNKRDHESMGGGSSDEDVGNDVKPPGFPESGGGGPGRGGRGSSLKGELSGGKKTKGRVKIKMEFIDNKLRRYTTFSKRKTGIMKKAYELSTLTGTQVMLLVASETGHVYTFATRKLQPMITSDAGKALIQTCLNSPDPSPHAGSSGGDQRMSATGYEETELTYNVAADEESQKVRQMMYNCNFSPSSTSSQHNLFSPLSPSNNGQSHAMYPAPSPSPSSSSHPGYPGSGISISPSLSHSPNHHSPPFGSGHPR